MDATDGRAYVALGKLLLQQKRVEEARRLYDDGAAATGMLYSYIKPIIGLVPLHQ